MGVTRRAARWLSGLLILALAVWAVTIGAVVWAADATLEAHRDGRGMAAPVDAIVVLGGGVDGDGGLSAASERRVAAAVEALEAGRADALIVSGGPAAGAPGAVAALLRAHAVRLGVPADRVLVEPRARSTFENLRFAFAVAEARGMERLALASEDYHLPRARALAAYFGRPDIGLVAAPGLSRERLRGSARKVLRESLAWWYNLGKVAAWEGLDTLGWEPSERAALVG